MTAQLQAVEAFRAFAEKTTGQPASVGLLSAGESIAVQVVTGSREFTSLDLANRRAVLSSTCCRNSRNRSRLTASSAG